MSCQVMVMGSSILNILRSSYVTNSFLWNLPSVISCSKYLLINLRLLTWLISFKRSIMWLIMFLGRWMWPSFLAFLKFRTMIIKESKMFLHFILYVFKFLTQFILLSYKGLVYSILCALFLWFLSSLSYIFRLS